MSHTSVMVQHRHTHLMARCPYCMSPVSHFDEICRTCGRIITGSAGADQRANQQFDRAAHMGGAQFGMAPQMSQPARPRMASRRRKKRKSKLRNLVLVAIVASVFVFTPANEIAMSQWAVVKGQLADLTAPVYPKQATFTVDRTITMTNEDSSEHSFKYSLAVPKDRTAKSMDAYLWQTQSGLTEAPMIQDIVSMKIISGSTIISIPVDAITRDVEPELRSIEAALGLSSESLDPCGQTPGPVSAGQNCIYWPGEAENDAFCSYGPCIKWEGVIPANDELSITVRYSVQAISYSWSANSDDGMPGEELGISASNSGTYADVQTRGDHFLRFAQQDKWFQRADGTYAIDGSHPSIKAARTSIVSGLPESLSDNPYAFARRAFEYVQDQVTYARGLETPRSGPTCLANGVGDCDEQANLWMSLMRSKDLPTWFEFGGLTSYSFGVWEPHGWSNVMLPYDTEWCNDRGIAIDTCYLEASVDVTNNMWLFKPPTALSLWVEIDDNDPAVDGGGLFDYYYRIWACANYCSYGETWQTFGNPMLSGGTFTNPQYIESFDK